MYTTYRHIKYQDTSLQNTLILVMVVKQSGCKEGGLRQFSNGCAFSKFGGVVAWARRWVEVEARVGAVTPGSNAVPPCYSRGQLALQTPEPYLNHRPAARQNHHIEAETSFIG